MGCHQGSFRMNKNLITALFSISLVFLPVRDSQAFILSSAAVSLYGGDAAAGTATVALAGVVCGPGCALAALIGVGMSLLTITDSSGNKIQIPTTTSIPVKAPVVTGTTPSPSSTGSCSAFYNGSYPSVAAACTAFMAASSAAWTTNGYTSQVLTGNTGDPIASYCSPSVSLGACSYKLNGVVQPTYSIYSTSTSSLGTVTCPAGYTVSGSTCVLTNAFAVVADKTQTFTRSGQVFSPISGDLTGSIQGIQGTTTSSNDTLTFSNNVNGNASNLIVQATPTGTLVTQQQQLSDASGNSYLKVDTVTLDSTGTVSSVSQYDTGQALAVSSTNPALLSPVTNPASSLSPQTQPTTGTIVFPTDYARQGEAAAAAASTNAVLATTNADLAILDNAVTTTTSVADPTAVDTTTMPVLDGSFTRLLSWTLPGHVSTCPAPSIDLSSVLGAGSVFVFDEHCTLFSANAAAIEAVMYLCWIIAAMFVVLMA
jgi:hypothetical protein